MIGKWMPRRARRYKTEQDAMATQHNFSYSGPPEFPLEIIQVTITTHIWDYTGTTTSGH